ncbi:CopM family metallochaperone [Pseudotabrizicola sp. L79]|uniref:CopM family metallochaperone n=1 Tax=Pseudotabrizicola sp. L79 TaxID=3118402 RepID=UPI002F9315AB
MKPALILALLGALALPAVALPALAQMADHSGHAGHTMAGTESPATIAFMEANAAMHADMAIDYTGNADVDFIKGMIPHHQGAVAMAQIVLEHGTDPEVRKLAEGIVAAQEAEIAWMQDWLAKNGQ